MSRVEADEDEATRHPDHWWHDPSGSGHNCTFCPSSSIWKCSPLDHLVPTAAEADFVRLVVEKVSRYGHEMTPETVVGFAYRITDLMIHSDEGLPLTSDNAVVVAAIMVATDRAEGREGAEDE